MRVRTSLQVPWSKRLDEAMWVETCHSHVYVLGLDVWMQVGRWVGGYVCIFLATGFQVGRGSIC